MMGPFHYESHKSQDYVNRSTIVSIGGQSISVFPMFVIFFFFSALILEKYNTEMCKNETVFMLKCVKYQFMKGP